MGFFVVFLFVFKKQLPASVPRFNDCLLFLCVSYSPDFKSLLFLGPCPCSFVITGDKTEWPKMNLLAGQSGERVGVGV